MALRDATQLFGHRPTRLFELGECPIDRGRLDPLHVHETLELLEDLELFENPFCMGRRLTRSLDDDRVLVMHHEARSARRLQDSRHLGNASGGLTVLQGELSRDGIEMFARERERLGRHASMKRDPRISLNAAWHVSRRIDGCAICTMQSEFPIGGLRYVFRDEQDGAIARAHVEDDRALSKRREKRSPALLELEIVSPLRIGRTGRDRAGLQKLIPMVRGHQTSNLIRKLAAPNRTPGR